MQKLVVRQAFEKRDEVAFLGIAQLETPNSLSLVGVVCTDGRAGACGDRAASGSVVVNDLGKRRDAAVVHVRAGHSNSSSLWLWA